MNNNESIGILGTGGCLPNGERYNNDPVYENIFVQQENESLSEIDFFKGFKKRYFLTADESLENLVVSSCYKALAEAKISAQFIDRIYGYLSVPKYLSPNSLFYIHQKLKLRTDCFVIPINSEYTNFLMGIMLAQEGISSGHLDYALVACGQNWSQHMDYSKGHSFSIGDGAGAAVIGRNAPLRIVDFCSEVDSHYYGAMAMQVHEQGNDYSQGDSVYYEINKVEGIDSFIKHGKHRPALFIKEFLFRNQIDCKKVDIICYQASRVLLDYWREQLYPAVIHESLEKFGNMSLATVPFNLDFFKNDLSREYVLLYSLGIGFHHMIVLLKRINN